MKVVERHYIDRQHRDFNTLDELSFKSKNLYNLSTYYMRQNFFEKGRHLKDRLTLKELYAVLKPTEAYQKLPAKVSNQVIKQVIHDWTVWKEATLAYLEDSSKFHGAPKIPNYKHKTCGRNLLVYDNQSIGQRGKNKNNGLLHLSQTNIVVQTRALDVVEVRVVPRDGILRYRGGL